MRTRADNCFNLRYFANLSLPILFYFVGCSEPLRLRFLDLRHLDHSFFILCAQGALLSLIRQLHFKWLSLRQLSTERGQKLVQGLVPNVGLSPACRKAEANFVIVGRWLNNLFKIPIGQVLVFEVILRRNTICS